MRALLSPILVCAAALTAGCQAPPPPDSPATTSTRASPGPVAPAAPAAPATVAPAAPAAGPPGETPQPGVPEPVSTLPTVEQDSCGASEYAVWLGQEYGRMPAAPAGKVVRVVCSTCPMTMDFNAERLNVIYDEKTGLVTRLSCG